MHRLVATCAAAACCWGQAELVEDRASRRPRCRRRRAVLYRALSRGLSFKTTMGNVLTLTPPPLTTTPEQMHAALDILDQCPSRGILKENRMSTAIRRRHPGARRRCASPATGRTDRTIEIRYP